MRRPWQGGCGAASTRRPRQGGGGSQPPKPPRDGQVVRPAHRWPLRQRPSQLRAHLRGVTDRDGIAALKEQHAATGHPGSNDRGMTVFLCSRCGTAITPEPAEPAAVPDVSDDERDRDKETRRHLPLFRGAATRSIPSPGDLPTSCRTTRRPRSRLTRAELWSAVKRASSFPPAADTRCWCTLMTPTAFGCCPTGRTAVGAADRQATRDSTGPAPAALRSRPSRPTVSGPFALHLDSVRTYAFCEQDRKTYADDVHDTPDGIRLPQLLRDCIP